MNPKISFLLTGFILLLLSFFLFQNSFAGISIQDTTITGIVTPVEWDEEDNVIAIAITVTVVPDDTAEEEYSEDYVVGDTEKGLELMQYVGEKVEATGTVEADEYGNKTIYVEKYRIIREKNPK